MWILHLLTVLLAAPAGVFLARRSSRNRAWIPALIAALAAIGAVGLARRVDRLAFVPPFSWVIDPRANPPLMVFLIGLLFGVLAPRLRQPRQRVFVWILAGAMACYFGLVPILSPVLVRNSLARGQTNMDANNVCRQRFDYTCGPAAGVTVLRSLGISADEGPLAIASGCGPAVGADGHFLARAMTDASGGRVRFTFCWVGDVSRLAPLTPAVVSLNSGPLRGHYVAVLSVTDKSVVLADPLSGLQRLSWDEFRADWAGSAVTAAKCRGD
jgi:hypothetical protein